MLKAESSIHVDASLDEVYRMWTEFESFPTFMEHVKQVKKVGDKRYHWKVDLVGQAIEFDADVTEMTPGKKISWKSVSGVQNHGTVEFRSDKSGTEIRAIVDYQTPHGLPEQASNLFASTLGNVLEHSMEKDLKHFKMRAEQQRPPMTDSGGYTHTNP